ncbi:DUF1801 domain-containing protein [Robiginitalea sp.]|uniref:DUF1801 domain-containing protein n=1 Tax=Robiginitalea sp. TaxID=1902411 RepID=UPI003C768B5F
MKPPPHLVICLDPYDPGIQEMAFYLRRLILEWVPETNELIWDGYNAVSMAYSKSEKLRDAFCHIAVYKAHVNLGFNRGTELSEDTLPLEGTGRLIRHYKVKRLDAFPVAGVKKMILEASELSQTRNPALRIKTSTGISKVMSVSDNKIRPKKNGGLNGT